MFRFAHAASGRATALGVVALAAIAAAAVPALGRQDEPKDDHSKPHPVPSFKGVQVLYSGKPEELAANWQQNGHDPVWKVMPDGALEVAPNTGDLRTKEKFGDYQLHVEWKEPYMPEAKGQARGNSGVYMQGRYEIQLLDSYGFETPGTGDCGAVYNQSAPLVNACKPPRQWQSYDIVFRQARLDANGAVVEPARVSIFQNGIAVQNNTAMKGVTGGADDKAEGTPGPIKLQDHHNRMQFRNIWIMPLPAEGSHDYAPH